MDYNLFANQVGLPPSHVELQAYESFWDAFRTSYDGNRAPFSLGQHFETWEAGAYDRALARFLVAACRLPEVRCVSFRELADFLDSLPAAVVRRYRAGRFPRFGTPSKRPEPKLNLFSTGGLDRLRREWSAAASK
jgi:hypothetical protein